MEGMTYLNRIDYRNRQWFLRTGNGKVGLILVKTSGNRQSGDTPIINPHLILKAIREVYFPIAVQVQD